ncbi:MAG: proton-conducting transporter membrane subunit [Hyphomonadaceae bacterium]
MLALTLNPGFVLIIAAMLIVALPKPARAPVMGVAAMVSLWLLLDYEFGAASTMAQMGLPVVLLDLDALNRVFGIGFLIALVLLSIYASARRNRMEDAAILLMAGGAVSALFVGDLISFLAALSLAGLASAWIVFASDQRGASAAGVRVLVWHGIEGLLFLLGIALHLSARADNSMFDRLDLRTIDGGFIFLGLMIRLGAPLAHVWLKDAVSHASSAGAVALSVFPSLLGLYALARLFPAEPALMLAGAGMVVIGLVFMAAEDDLRRAAAYAQTSQLGVCVALLGVGAPLARAGAEAHAFTLIFSFALVQMALGAACARIGEVRLSALGGLGRAMPITAALMFVGGLTVAATPGFGAYISYAVALEAASSWELRWLWTMFAVASAASIVCLALRPALAAYFPIDAPAPFREAPFPMLLGAITTAFFCLAMGLAPGWLYRLTATQVHFAPFALDRLAPHLSMLGSACVAYLLLRAFRLTPGPARVALMDMDTFYRGPVAAAGRWIGIVLIRLSGAWGAASARASQHSGRVLSAFARACDRPYADRLSGAIQFAAIGAILALVLLAKR